MRLRRIIFAAAVAILLFPRLHASASSPLPILVYSSPICETCRVFEEQIQPQIERGYAGRIAITKIDILKPDGMAALEAEEKRLGRFNNPAPVIVIGDLLISNDDVLATGEQLRQALLERLGPPQDQPTSTAPVIAATSAPPSGATVAVACTAPIYVALVEKDGCDTCSRARTILQALALEHTGLVVKTFNHVRDAEIVEAMGVAMGLPSARRLIAPSIYVGRDALVSDEISLESVRRVLSAYEGIGAPPPWDNLDTSTSRQSILQRFRAMGPLAVVAAALIDGINPCAFATILFFVSYLAVSRRRRRDLLYIGLCFTAGVFLAYLLVGVGAMGLVRLLNSFRVVGILMYTLMAVSCFVLAGFSLYDYTLARQGKLHEMRLNLPNGLRERIKSRIRASSGAFAGAAFLSGLFVSLMELACTGQVYLPTITFVASIPEMRAHALLLLILYNAIFVMPLLAVLLLAAYGMSAARFQTWFLQHAAVTKLGMVALFLVLGFLLLAQVLTL